MLRLLPFILIPILIVSALGYWRFVVIKQSIAPLTQVDTKPIEVPKQLPKASLDDRVASLENTISKLASQVNGVKTQTANTSDSELNNIEASIADLKTRVAVLEKATPAPVSSSSKSTVYIPLGSGGQINGSSDWTSLATFQATVDPSSYPEYKSMQLEVNMRLNQPGGTLYARLYSSGSLDSSQVSSTTTSSTLLSSSTFNLSGGLKTYTLQAKTTDGSQAFLDNARIKVNF